MLSLEAVWHTVQPIAAILGTLGLSVSLVVTVSWTAFRWFGQTWIESKFSRAMEEYKSEQAQELERLRHRINSTFDRLTRLHDREFEVLPDLWGKLVEARLWAISYVSSFQSYPDIARLEDDALAEYLAERPFAEWQRREIMNAEDRQEQFIKTHNRYRYSDVNDKIRAFELAFAKNGIFLSADLESMMQKLIDFINAAVIEHNINEEHDVRPRHRDGIRALEKEGKELHQAIKKAVTDRLWESANKAV
jgi:hypothetical protein